MLRWVPDALRLGGGLYIGITTCIERKNSCTIHVKRTVLHPGRVLYSTRTRTVLHPGRVLYSTRKEEELKNYLRVLLYSIDIYVYVELWFLMVFYTKKSEKKYFVGRRWRAVRGVYPLYGGSAVWRVVTSRYSGSSDSIAGRRCYWSGLW